MNNRSRCVSRFDRSVPWAEKPVQLFWRLYFRSLDAMDPAARSANIAGHRSTLLETTQASHKLGIALAPFYDVAQFQVATKEYASDPLLATSVARLLHRAFDYYSLEVLARITQTVALKRAHLEVAFERMAEAAIEFGTKAGDASARIM